MDIACWRLNFCTLFGMRASYVGTITDDFFCASELFHKLLDFSGIDGVDLFWISPIGDLQSVRSVNYILWSCAQKVQNQWCQGCILDGMDEHRGYALF